jgi:SH3-like domain-containing protein
MISRRAAPSVAAWIVLMVPVAGAAEYRSVGEAAAVMYDAPSAKSKPLFVLGRDTPLEVIVPVEGWSKVRDAGGTIGWVERKSLGDKRTLLVRVPLAEIRAKPDDNSALVFRAEQNVLLDLAESAATAAAASSPGWVKVRHRDGQTGYVRITQIFGL